MSRSFAHERASITVDDQTDERGSSSLAAQSKRHMSYALEPAELRRQAEELLNCMRYDTDKPPPDSRDLIRELQVCQLELQMQNETLRELVSELEAARARYYDLYESAPVAYLSVGANTRIVEANRAASLMLGVERTKLLGKCLSGFVEPHMAGVFALHCRAVLESDQVQNCELLLVVGEGTRRVRLESARVSAAAQHWRTAV